MLIPYLDRPIRRSLHASVRSLFELCCWRNFWHSHHPRHYCCASSAPRVAMALQRLVRSDSRLASGRNKASVVPPPPPPPLFPIPSSRFSELSRLPASLTSNRTFGRSSPPALGGPPIVRSRRPLFIQMISHRRKDRANVPRRWKQETKMRSLIIDGERPLSLLSTTSWIRSSVLITAVSE